MVTDFIRSELKIDLTGPSDAPSFKHVLLFTPAASLPYIPHHSCPAKMPTLPIFSALHADS